MSFGFQVLGFGAFPNRESGYQITNALVFDGVGDYLQKTFGSAGNNDTGTISFWVKRNTTGTTDQLFHSRSSSGSSQLAFSSDALYWRLEDTGGNQVGQLTTNALFRDTTAWYHIVVNFDTTNGTAAQRMRVYVNGVEETSFSARANPSSGADSTISDATTHYIGSTHSPGDYAAVTLTEYVYIDGTQLAADSFGKFDANGYWVPIDCSGLTFGTNGFYLKFDDPKNLGRDASVDTGTAPVATFEAQYVSSADATAYTFSSADLGSAASNRSIVVGVGAGRSSATPARIVNSMTINGVTATFAARQTTLNDNAGAEFWSAPVPTGTSGDIVVTFNAAMVRAGIGVWSVTDLGPPLDSDGDKGDDGAEPILQVTVTGSKDSIAFYHLYDEGAVDGMAFTGAGVTERYETISSSFEGDGGQAGADATFAASGHKTVEIAGTGSDTTFNDGALLGVVYGKANEIQWKPVSLGSNNITSDTCTNSTTAEVTFYPALDPLTKHSSITLSNNNLTHTGTDAGVDTNTKVNFAMPSTGKFYFEFMTESTTGIYIGFSEGTCGNNESGNSKSYQYYQANGNFYQTGGNASYGASWTEGDVIGVAMDITNGGDLWFSKNNTWQNSATASEIAAGTVTNAALANVLSSNYDGSGLFVSIGDSSAAGAGTLMFEENSWFGTAPTGFGELTRTVTGTGNWNTISTLFTREQGSFSSPAGSITLSNGATTVAFAHSGTNPICASTVPLMPGGKYHFEFFISEWGSDDVNAANVNLIPWSKFQNTANLNASGVYHYFVGSWKPARGYTYSAAPNFNGTSLHTLLAAESWDIGDLISLDVDMSTVGETNVIYKINGTTIYSAEDLAFLDEPYFVCPQHQSNGSGRTATYVFNFGQTPFDITPATDHVGIATHTMPAVTDAITKPHEHFKTVIYEGTGSELAISSLEFKPDFVWIKNRDTTDAHMLYDSVREATKDLHPSTADQESTTAQTLKSFDTAGFTLGTDVQVNTSSENYVAWCLKAGGAPTTDNDNTSGAMDDGSVFKGGVVQSSYTPAAGSNYPKKMSIASHGGFSIIEYTGTGANATVPHGLSRTPDHFMLKPLTQDHSWAGYHSAMGTGSGNDKVNRWDTTTIGDQAGDAWQNNPFATEHVITFGSQTGQNENNIPHIMYVWAKTPGLIGIGSYTASGNDIGPQVVVDDGASGFRPAFVYTKRIDANNGDWWITDSVRTTFNPMSKAIYIDNQAEEDAGDNRIDFLANGFKLRDDSARRNTVSSGTNNFMYLAFAESPFSLNNRAR